MFSGVSTLSRIRLKRSLHSAAAAAWLLLLLLLPLCVQATTGGAPAGGFKGGFRK
jgi:hypothetical protein